MCNGYRNRGVKQKRPYTLAAEVFLCLRSWCWPAINSGGCSDSDRTSGQYNNLSRPGLRGRRSAMSLYSERSPLAYRIISDIKIKHTYRPATPATATTCNYFRTLAMPERPHGKVPCSAKTNAVSAGLVTLRRIGIDWNVHFHNTDNKVCSQLYAVFYFDFIKSNCHCKQLWNVLVN